MPLLSAPRSFQEGDYVAVHKSPVWRGEADYLIHAFLGEKGGRCEWEQLWAKRTSERRFMLCCIPFFTYGLSLGDEVGTNEDLSVDLRLKASGRAVFRVWFQATTDPAMRDKMARALQGQGALLEWSSVNLLALSTPVAAKTDALRSSLRSAQETGLIQFEDGLD